MYRQAIVYSDLCVLRPPIQPGKYRLKLEVVLKWRDIYMYLENIRVVPLMAGHKMAEIIKWRCLKLQGPLCIDMFYGDFLDEGITIII